MSLSTAGCACAAFQVSDCREYASSRKGVNMADKSPRKIASKKSGKTLKEKRQEKKAKEQSRKGLSR